MPLIVEDGKKPEGANSYADIEACDDYQSERGNAKWPVNEKARKDPNAEAKEAALIKATDYLNGLQWKGRRASGGRVMAWPRIEVTDADGYDVPNNIIPQNVVYACCYLAGLIYSGVDVQPVLERGGRIQSESVGSLATHYFDDAANRDIYAAVADLLCGLAYGFGDYAGVGHTGSSGFGKVVIG